MMPAELEDNKISCIMIVVAPAELLLHRRDIVCNEVHAPQLSLRTSHSFKLSQSRSDKQSYSNSHVARHSQQHAVLTCSYFIILVMTTNEDKWTIVFKFFSLGQTSSLDSDTEDDYDLIEDLKVAWKLSIGAKHHGCRHYRRRCQIRAPCCDEVFDCRHCHNEAKKENEMDPAKRHEMPRHLVEKVICSLCQHEQDVQQVCEKCGVCMGDYFCSKCKFFDDETKKHQYHCDECGICRMGGRHKFFHCDKCGCCYSTALQNKHTCVEKSMHQDCPVCMEYMFDSVEDITVLRCGHTIHLKCLREMHSHAKYSCPICSKSSCDMSNVWRQFDQEIASTTLPVEQQNIIVWILCNDCETTAEVQYHVVGQKCTHCNSFNTRLIQHTGTSASSSTTVPTST